MRRILLLELCPAILAVVGVVLDSRWKRELFTTPFALPLHDLRNIMLVLVFPLALLAVIRDMLPGRSVEDWLPTRFTWFLQEFGFFFNWHGCNRSGL